jgi:hypothetical protein
MRTKGVVIFFSLLIAVAITAAGGFLYFFAGGRQALVAKNYVKQHPNFQDSLYTPAGSGRHGGIFAGIWAKKIWLWTRGGLRSYQSDEKTDYSLLIGCNQQDQKENKVQSKGLTIEEWLETMRPGDFVFVVVDEANQTVVERVWGIDHWMFMVNKEIEEQCLAAGRTINGKN